MVRALAAWCRDRWYLHRDGQSRLYAEHHDTVWRWRRMVTSDVVKPQAPERKVVPLVRRALNRRVA